jgi:hypothetical protein
MSDVRISRRSLLKGALLTVAAVPAASLLSRQALAANPLVDPNDAQAKSLGYVHDAAKVDAKANPNFKAGQHCANCIQYTGKAGDAEGWLQPVPGQERQGRGLVQGVGAEARRFARIRHEGSMSGRPGGARAPRAVLFSRPGDPRAGMTQA